MIPIIILAAGMSTRFPGNKLLYNVRGKPLIKHVVEAALGSKADEVLVVLGYKSEEIARVISNYDVVLVYNPEYKRGMSYSVKRGIRAVYKWAKAAIIHPADVAFVPSTVFDKVIDKYEEKQAPIVVASYRGEKGHPILFSGELFDEILKINEETFGLKAVTRKYRDRTVIVNTDYKEVVVDIDTIEDLKKLGLL